VIGLILTLFVLLSPISSSNILQLPITENEILLLERKDCPINLTVNEAWELLNDTSNGIQIPIDLRSEEDWNESFIDTPWPEHPRWIGHIDNFTEEFEGKEVLFYCKGGYQSLLRCYMLCEAGFNGTLYNMIGGFTAWIEAGLPIRNNTPPEAPEIKIENPRAKPLKDPTKKFIFKTIDPDGDKIYLFIDWDDGTLDEWIGPYNSGEEIIITHTFLEPRIFGVKAKAKDIFEAEGPWGTLKIPIREKGRISNSFIINLANYFPFLGVLLRIIN
jgi:rhodanese-related sulfurtransferase